MIIEDLRRMKQVDTKMNDFGLPMMLKQDCEYQKALEDTLKRYCDFIEKHSNEIMRNCFSEVKQNSEGIIEALSEYYAGYTQHSYKLIYEIVSKYKNNQYIVSNVKESYAFKGAASNPPSIHRNNYREMYEHIKAINVILYKGRCDKRVLDRGDMLHIPFDMRGIVKNQRFSINGLPCIYLASTTYGAWRELDCPDNNMLQVSAYRIPSDLKIFNLCIQQHLINGVGSYADDNELEQLKVYVSIFPLVIATSAKVEQNDRTFKSEYIISQILMQVCKEMGIEGIAYISKKDMDSKMYPSAVNLAIMGNVHKGKKYDERIEQFQLTKPVKFSDFLLLPEETKPNAGGAYKSLVNEIYHGTYSDTVFLAGKDVCYTGTVFSKFDEYLANLEFKTVSRKNDLQD